MGTQDMTGTGVSAVQCNTFTGPGGLTVFQRRITLSAAAPQNEVIQCIDIPAGFTGIGVSVKIITAVSTATDLDLGDDTAADAWLNGFSGAATGYPAATVFGAHQAAGGKYYGAADTLDLKVTGAGAATGLVFDVAIFGFMIQS